MKLFTGILVSLLLSFGYFFQGKSQINKNDSIILDSAIVLLDSASAANASNFNEIKKKVDEIIEFKNEDEFNQMAIEGIALFNGDSRLENGGPSCISCHVLNAEGVALGGFLGLDLSNSYTIVNKEKGLQMILKTPTSPIMKLSFADSPITKEEMKRLIALLKKSDMNKEYQFARIDEVFLLKYGICGVIVIMVILLFVWRNRKKKSVKHDIYSRQLKTL